MTADGTDDDKIKPEGLNDCQVPPPMLLLNPANAEPSSNDITPAEDGPDDVDFKNEDMVSTDDTGELEDKAGDWEYDNPFVGRHLRGLYENRWLVEYVIHYSDGTRDFVKDQDFDGIELFFC